jgi:SNF2 family DNA or RNA helicase
MAASKEDLLEKHKKVYELLKKVRESKTVSLKPTSMLRSEIVDLDGTLQPLRLRYYQVQAIFHLLSMKRMVLGDAAGSGKTICAIASLCYAWEKEPTNKAIIIVPKSALRQWAAEIERFATGIKIFLIDGKLPERKKTYEAFAAYAGNKKAVMLMGYAILMRDWNEGATRPLKPDGQPDMKAPLSPGLLNGITKRIPNLTIIADECTAFKNNRTKTWQVCRELSDRANRCYGLTATLLKNNLIEGFCIYKCIYPDVFNTKTNFMDTFCVTRMQPVAGGRKVPIIIGYKNLELFRQRIDPFFLGRPKHVISDELPKLITREVIVKLSTAEEAKYEEALSGILSLGDGEVKDYEEHKRFVALIYCQLIVNSLSLIRYKQGDVIDLDLVQEEQVEVEALSSKEQALLDLLTDEFEDEKVIVYTRFASLIPRLQTLCKKSGIESVAITGKVVDTKNNPARQKAMQAFQDLKSKFRVIFISDAGSEAINLQAAGAMIFFDAPWSWGNYVQLLGRPIRIGSPHQHVIAVHLVAERSGDTVKERKTIDRYTLEILQRKKNLFDKVLGEAAVGALDFGSEGSFTRELIKSLRESRSNSGVDKPRG